MEFKCKKKQKHAPLALLQYALFNNLPDDAADIGEPVGSRCQKEEA